MSELEEARAEALKYKLLFLGSTAYFIQAWPKNVVEALYPSLKRAYDTIEDTWGEHYGDTNVKDLVLEELTRIGDQNE